ANTLSASADKVLASVAATDNKSSVGNLPINRKVSPSPSLLLDASAPNSKEGSVALSIFDESNIDSPPTRPSPSANTLSASADKVLASVAATDNKSSVGNLPINRKDSSSPTLLLFTSVNNSKVGSVALSISANKLADIETIL
ncbi:hypothetical protein CDIK_3069, partial [Cucumispora dikerogammari]